MSRRYVAVIWAIALAAILLTFVFARFASNDVHARRLEDAGKLDRAESLYAHVLETKATSLEDSLNIIRLSKHLSSTYYPILTARLDPRLNQLENNDSKDLESVLYVETLYGFSKNYYEIIASHETRNEAIDKEYKSLYDRLCLQKIQCADQLLSRGRMPEGAMQPPWVALYMGVAADSNQHQASALARLYVLNRAENEDRRNVKEGRYQTLKAILRNDINSSRPEEAIQKLDNLLSLQSDSFDFTELVERLEEELELYRTGF